ncbi:MAG: hypothetical protein HY903_03120 [Deltaproteobacteria bacterium]|nr:hypothetical protein [Deltaproteobacteria bacterium]
MPEKLSLTVLRQLAPKQVVAEVEAELAKVSVAKPDADPSVGLDLVTKVVARLHPSSQEMAALLGKIGGLGGADGADQGTVVVAVDLSPAESFFVKTSDAPADLQAVNAKLAELLADPLPAPSPAPEPVAALPELQPEAKAQPKPEPQPEAKAQPKPQPKAQPKPQPKAQPKPQPKAQPKPQPKAQPKPQPKAQPKPQPKAQPKPQPKAQPKPQPKAQPKPQPARRAVVQPAAKPMPVLASQPYAVLKQKFWQSMEAAYVGEVARQHGSFQAAEAARLWHNQAAASHLRDVYANRGRLQVLNVPQLLRAVGLDNSVWRLHYNPFKQTVLDRFERAYIAELLDECRGNVDRAAAAARMSSSEIWALVRQHNLRDKVR